MMAAGAGENKGRGGSTDDGKEREVPPRWCLFVLSHQFHVDVRLFCGAVHVLLPDVLAMVKIRVYNERGDGGE